MALLVVASLVVTSGILGYVIASSKNTTVVKTPKSAKRQGPKKVLGDEKSKFAATPGQPPKIEEDDAGVPSEASSGSGDILGVVEKLGATQKRPTLRFFNAYRTRTFWLPEGFKGTKKSFTVAFRLESLGSESAQVDPSKSPSGLVPTIQWESRPKISTGVSQVVAKGTIVGQPHKNIQVVTLPPQAWQVDGQGVDVEMKLQWQPEGGSPDASPSQSLGQQTLAAKSPLVPSKDFSKGEERATLRLRSIDGYLKQNPTQGVLVRFTDAPSKQTLVKAPAPQSQWLTSWGQVESAPGALSVTFPPGTSSQTVAKILKKAHDFQLSSVPWQASQDESGEVWIQEGKQVLSLKKRGTLRPETTDGVSKTLSGIYPDAMRFRGSAQHYACDIKGATETVAECLKQNPATNFQLYSPTRNPPFITVKRDIVLMPSVRDMLIKEGRYLFTDQVEVLSMDP